MIVPKPKRRPSFAAELPGLQIQALARHRMRPKVRLMMNPKMAFGS